MKARLVLPAILISAVLVTALAPAALARGELLTAEPGRINFGSVAVDCEVVDSGQRPDCPTVVVTLTNAGQTTLRLDSIAPCGRIIGPTPTCETSNRFPGWGGMTDANDPIDDCFIPLAPGDSCTLTLLAKPDVTRPVHGSLAIWGGPGAEMILRVPVRVRGT